mmetsp:Transcript_28000/g.90279  ORF Transcript_28000/g.90279 Transcript_28000/m.90279 type:complete len:658 (+) Transcript_28000:35-2008(+)
MGLLLFLLRRQRRQLTTLRPYQAEAVAALESAVGNPLYVLPTGGGKTVVLAELVRRWEAKGLRTLYLVHRREIFDQTLEKLGTVGVEPEVIAAHRRRKQQRQELVDDSNDASSNDQASLTTLATVQTLVRRGNVERDFDRVVVDEAHHATATTWQTVLKKFPGARRIGATATPFRLDGAPLGDSFDSIVEGPTIRDLASFGHLVLPRYRRKKLIEVSNVRISTSSRNGSRDYEESELSTVARVANDAVADDVAANLGDRRAIAFAVDVDHSRSLAAAFRRKGYAVAHVDSSTTAEARNDVFRRFRDFGSSSDDAGPQIICNCEIATEGFDAPACSAVILARPTKSKGLFLQMSGRGLRPHAQKKDCLFFDFADQLREHGAVTDPLDYTLQGGLVERLCRKRDDDDEDSGDKTRTSKLLRHVVPEEYATSMEDLTGVEVRVSDAKDDDGLRRIRVSWDGGDAEAAFRSETPPRVKDATIYAGGFNDAGTFHSAFFERCVLWLPRDRSDGFWFKRLITLFMPPTRDDLLHHFSNLTYQQLARGFKRGWVYHKLKDRWGPDLLRKERYDYEEWESIIGAASRPKQRPQEDIIVTSCVFHSRNAKDGPRAAAEGETIRAGETRQQPNDELLPFSSSSANKTKQFFPEFPPNTTSPPRPGAP